uniref:hypothetical protein n=1 Tax=Pluralibacter gergoviae TaxID=61647 RepID=UPI0011134ACA|nr:hypothetical protein [Pluralibacter gergoviae]
MKKISYFPVGEFSNKYSEVFLNSIRKEYQHDNVLLSDLVCELKSFNFKRRDVVILNWFENLFSNSDGNITLYLILKSFIKFIIYRIKYKKVIYVRHNVYPHHLNNKSLFKAKTIIYVLTKLSSASITHSPVYREFNEIYVPHPLYEFPVVNSNASERDPNLYIIFGRITRYKQLEKIIDIFPSNKNLLILGACDDLQYLDELKKNIKSKKNILIKSGFVSDEEARGYFSRANSLLLCHSEPHMIVSGSFFYALTMGIRTLCISTPFLKWTENELGSNVVKCFDSLDTLADYLINASPFYGFTDQDRNIIVKNFSSDVVRNSILNVIENVA